MGRDQDPAQFGPQPPNVFIERYIPHTGLLPYCDVVSTHGGFSSVMACFNQGVPMVLIPLAGGDQRGNAHRCAALGVGRIIAPDQRTPEQIREAVLEVLGNRRYRERAEQVRDEMQLLPEPEYAVALLEKLTAGPSTLARGKGYLAIIGNSQADVRRRRNVKGELRSGTRSIL